MYLDGDRSLPTLCGTGTEDYIATGWGQGVSTQRYHGCLIANAKTRQYAFYRYHLPDPVYLDKDCRVTIHQIGGSSRKDILAMLEKGVEITPISVDHDGRFINLLDPPANVAEVGDDSSWTKLLSAG